MIREMQNKTKTRIQIPSQPNPSQPHRTATIFGTLEGCDKVREMIDRIINEQSSASVMSGSSYLGQQEGQYFPGSQPPSQANCDFQQSGQEKISAEWQAYYAAQALAKQQQGQSGKHSEAIDGSAASTSRNTDLEGYYEQFFRYWYYYGEDAARKYYGVWSPPAGTPNPYGSNPSRSAASPSDPEVVRLGEVKDSSVRKVSNLPAWMTRGD